MKNVRVAFQTLDEDEPVLIGYKFIRCHMILDVRMEDFRRKDSLVAGGHMTETPATMIYASIIYRESVGLALMIIALNVLQVKCGNVKNAYITASITEKVWSILRPKFGADAGRKAIIVHDLYGLKSAGAAFRSHIYICMRGLGYEPYLDDTDLWYKAEVRPNDVYDYYN